MKSAKIFWYCFKRQLGELYSFLISEKLISCDVDEFTSHFTGKKWPDTKDYNGKLMWNRERNLFTVLQDHLNEKGFVESSFEEHFGFKYSSKQAPGNEVNKFREVLISLFPERTGYRCKERLYYRERNKKNKFSFM